MSYHEDELLKLNEGWPGAEYAPAAANWASRRGVSLKTTPPIVESTLDFVDSFAEKIGIKLGFSNRVFTIGSSIYSPEGYVDRSITQNPYRMRENPDGSLTQEYYKHTDKQLNQIKSNKYTSLVRDEAPHVAQWRNEGTIGFVSRHAKELAEHGGGGATYNIPNTHEHDTHSNPAKEKELLESLQLLEGYSEEENLPFNY
jgi:hypothetical protein